MSSIKDVGRALVGIASGYLVGMVWGQTRPEDPSYYPLGVGIIVAVLVFGLLHLIGKDAG